MIVGDGDGVDMSYRNVTCVQECVWIVTQGQWSQVDE